MGAPHEASNKAIAGTETQILIQHQPRNEQPLEAFPMWVSVRAETISELWCGCVALGFAPNPGPRLGHERLTQDEKGREISRNDEKGQIPRFIRNHLVLAVIAEVRSLLRG